MAYKMKGFSYPGASPMKQSKFPNSTKALNRKKNKPTDNKDEDLQTNQNTQLSEVPVGGEKTKQKERKIVQAQQIPITSVDPVLEKSDHTPIATANKNRKSRAKFKSDVSSFISGIAGIPGEIVGEITGKASDVGGWAKIGVDKIRANKLARKQDKIDNPKPEKVKKVKEVKVKKTKAGKSGSTPPNLSGTSDDKKVDLSKKTNLGPRATEKKAVSSKKVEYANNTLKVDEKKVDKTVEDNKKKARKENITKSWKSAKSQIGEQLITQGIEAGIQALLTPKEKEQRDRSNPNLGGFSQMKFGRRPMKE